jgi:hypothetical protein
MSVPIKRCFWANADDIVGMALPCRAMGDIEAVCVTGTEIKRELHEIAENLQRIERRWSGKRKSRDTRGVHRSACRVQRF